MHFMAKGDNSGQVVTVTLEQAGPDVLVRMGTVVVAVFEGATPVLRVYEAAAAQYSVPVDLVRSTT